MPDPLIEPGTTTQASYVVTGDDTAIAVGSGSLPVLGTPRLLAWCESVTCAAIADALSPEQTSVGTRVSLEHLAASPVGATVTVEATVAEVDGRTVVFDVIAQHRDDTVVGRGLVTRVVVDAERFLARLG